MTQLLVITVASDSGTRRLLEEQLEATGLVRVLQGAGHAASHTDPELLRLRDSTANVAVIDIPADDPKPGLQSIENLRRACPGIFIVAVGNISQPETIISAMRLGAGEFLQRPITSASLTEALKRIAERQRHHGSRSRGTVLGFVNAKGGSGSTTLAVNCAVGLQQGGDPTVLVDLATLGNVSIHLNLKPAFSISDVIPNLRRLDVTLLKGFLTNFENGLHVLAGSPEPSTLQLPQEGVAAIIDLLAAEYRYVIVDLSNRIDDITKAVMHSSNNLFVVCHTDVPSLWSAERVQRFLCNGNGHHAPQLILNRFGKVPGLSDADIETLTHTRIAHKVPNHYPQAARAIDRGSPMVLEERSELAKSLAALVSRLNGRDDATARKSRSLFGWSM